MKLKTLLLTSILLSKTLFASHSHIVHTYIPMTDPKTEKIILFQVPFYTYYAEPYADIGSVTWSYEFNTPHQMKIFEGIEGNLAHIEGLKVTLDDSKKSGCEITIDSRDVVSNDETGDLNIILPYVKEATVLNMKNAKLNCKIISKTTPKKMTKFSPKALDLSKRNVEVFKENVIASSHIPFVQDTIYPLGYSSDGKFAYIIEHDNTPAGFLHVETFVQDLVTDKIIWRDNFEDTNIPSGNDGFKTFWEKRKSIIKKNLTAFKIEPLKDITLTRGEHGFSFDQFTLSSKVATHYAKNWSSDFLTSSSIYIHSKKQGQKTINEESYKKGSQRLSRKPIGIFSSKENYKRVAVLVGTVTRGWEGPPHNLGYAIIGANLEVGFEK